MCQLLVTGLALILLTACQPGLVPAPGTAGSVVPATTQSGSVLLQGRVMFPGFRTKATPGDVSANAGVSLIDTNGDVVAGGVTDGSGNFTLYQSNPPFTPVNGGFYTLEATHRPVAGPLLTLRTTLQRLGTSWTSITGGTVVINPTTTAVALIDAEDAAVTPANTMGSVSGANFDVVAAIGTWSPARITARATGVTATIANGKDAAGAKTMTWTGNYTITNADDAANLAEITAITGTLTVNAPGLAVVDLPNLRSIGGSLGVFDQSALTTLKLSSLREVPGGTSIWNNDALTTLRLESLTTVGGAMNIYSNDALTNLAGLSGLTTVTGPVTISYNTALTSLAGLTGLTTVGGLGIVNNPALTSLTGLGNLTTIGTNLSIGYNGMLTTLGLTSLTKVTTTFEITSNVALAGGDATASSLRNGLSPLPVTTFISGNQ